MVKTVIFFSPSKGKTSGRTMVLLCRANVTDSDLTLDKFKDLFSPSNHIQNNHILLPDLFILSQLDSSSRSLIRLLSSHSVIPLQRWAGNWRNFFSLESVLFPFLPASYSPFYFELLHEVHIFSCFSFAKRTQIYYLCLLPHVSFFFFLLCPLSLHFPCHVRANFP